MPPRPPDDAMPNQDYNNKTTEDDDYVSGSGIEALGGSFPFAVHSLTKLPGVQLQATHGKC